MEVGRPLIRKRTRIREAKNLTNYYTVQKRQNLDLTPSFLTIKG